MKRIKFKDLRLFGGWLTIIYAPRLIVWWSTDATPPCSDNSGKWIVGSWRKYAGING